jgi:uncharacterized protein YciI
MKGAFTFIAVFIATTVYGQAELKAVDSLYIVTYTTGPAWDNSKSPNDQPYFKEHSARLAQLRKEGVIKFGARYGNKGSIGIAAKNFQAAKAIVFGDPAVVNKLFDADLQKLNIFYEGCLER